MIIYEIGELRNQDKIDTLIKDIQQVQSTQDQVTEVLQKIQ